MYIVDAEADVARTNVVTRPPQGSSKGKVLEILRTQEPTEAEVERTNVVPRTAQGSSKVKEAKVERTTGVTSIEQGSSKGKVLEILDTQKTADSDPVMLLDVNVQTEVKESNDVMGAPRKSRNEQVKEDTVEHTDVQGYSLGIRTRTSPKALWETVKALNSNQRAAIKEMGFDALLDMTLFGIPSKLGHYVVDMLDTSNMTIQLRDGQIPITVKSIHDVLGLPTGGLDLNLVAPSKCNDAVVSAWRKQFSKDRMRPKDVMNVIQQSDDAGVMFKMSFLVIMLNTLA
ncbi:hypothetical protein Ccrd_010415 [Cynara cardunculus var. scolymus]|uniref:Uncharacterized protein n=1 Tax=Cynara cardunculus var. scolymus TaxID=59895 RepID=A0A124SI06_CYNCS|nr:hypothetical protein Ccrd_010415 [Cynara cardunculus var. scolymus]